MFRLLLGGTFGAVIALALGIAGLAWWCAAHTAHQFERVRLSQEVRAEFLRLCAVHEAALQEAARSGAGFGGEAARAALAQQFATLRRVNMAEMALVPGDPREEAEMHRLAALELAAHAALDRIAGAAAALREEGSAEAMRRFEAALADGFGAEFQRNLDAAVREEEEEAARTEAAARAALELAAELTRAGMIGVVLIGGGAMVLLFRRLQRPLGGLAEAARAAAAGDLTRRIAPEAARGEFAPVAASFNAMIDEVARSRAAMEATRGALEAAVAARTVELASANATLRQGDDARRRFLADVSHELRTPLTVIRGEAEVALRAERPAEEYRRALTRVAEEAALTARLVDDLLFVARSEAGEARVAVQAVAFDEVVRRAAAAARALAAPRRVRVIERACAQPVVVQGDPERLRQLVIILLDNAVRYSDPGGDVTVTLAPAKEGVQLTVADAGMGIAEEEIERVFERFYRGDGAAARHAEGAGLGLPLARAIARAHGGELALESRLGEGSTARLTLPVVRRLRAVA